jgi:hypothetical protein
MKGPLLICALYVEKQNNGLVLRKGRDERGNGDITLCRCG